MITIKGRPKSATNSQSKRSNSNPGITRNELKTTLSLNRLSSKYNPEYIYTIRNKIDKSEGSCTIMLTDSIYEQPALNSN